MKRSLLAVAALSATFAVGAMAPAYAQTSQPPSAPAPESSAPPTGATKIAVIAFQPAVASTNEGRAAFEAVQKKFAPKQAELKALSEQIDTLKKDLQAKGSTLSEDARASQLRTIDDKEKSLQREAQDAQSDYQSAVNDAFQGLAQKFYAVLQEYAQAHGYGAVFDSSSQQTPIVWAAKSADISAAVVAEYNRKSGVAAPAASATHSSVTPTHRRTTPATRH